MRISRTEDNKESYVKEIQSLFQMYSPEKAVSIMAKKYGNAKKEPAEELADAEVFKGKKRQVETIGIYYHRMTPGGVQKVVSLLVPLYLEAGYRVVLFTDEKEQGEYELPSRTIRVVLPSALLLSYDRYEERAVLLRNMLEEHQVDTMLYHGAESRFLLYDMLLVKALGIPFCVVVHSLFSAEMLRLNTHIAEKRATFRLADRLVVLSETEKLFWESLGIPAVYIPNPIQELTYAEEEGKYILWLGRLEETEKQTSHSIEIMKRVVKVCPEARMKIVGPEVTHRLVKNLKKRIKKLGLEKHIEICGMTGDAADYYKEAKIFLCTSACEAFSMTIAESKGYGIPLVTYDMPYLEVLKSRQGCICVPQDDVESAAKAVIRILQEENLRKELKEQARKSYESLREFDLTEAWEYLLTGLSDADNDLEEVPVSNENVRLLLETLLDHYEKGCRSNGEKAEDVFLRNLWKIGRAYRFWKENGWKKTKDIIVRKIGDTHDKN